jgi:all-trans-retinol dehydrogenase (NAD+)
LGFQIVKPSLVVKKMTFLPREGITLEALFAPLRQSALQPFLVGPLLYASTVDILRPFLSLHNRPVLVKVLKVLLAMGVLRTANNALSKLVMNNWTMDSWRKGEEVVLITGGGSGIGELMARDLAQWSKAIIVFDLAPSKISLRKWLIFSNSERQIG